MSGPVKLIFAFWIIVILGIMLAAIIVSPWLLILVAAFIIVGVVFIIKDKQDEKENAEHLVDQQRIKSEKQELIAKLEHKQEESLTKKLFGSNKELTDDNLSEEISLKNLPTPTPTISDNQTSYNSLPKVLSTTQTLNEAESKIVLEPFDMFTGVQFKDLIEKHFKKNGYSVNRISPRINSIDFLIEKDGKVTAIATKKTFELIQRSYINNVIESAKMYDGITKIMVITTSFYFMPQARQLAEENSIILWNREDLKSKL